MEERSAKARAGCKETLMCRACSSLERVAPNTVTTPSPEAGEITGK